jgi:hypothetical protein
LSLVFFYYGFVVEYDLIMSNIFSQQEDKRSQSKLKKTLFDQKQINETAFSHTLPKSG